MNNPACSNCAHAAPQPLTAETLHSRALICRRWPPAPVAFWTPQGIATGTHWPTVTEADTCGEFCRADIIPA